MLVLCAAAVWRGIDDRYHAKDAVVLLPLRQFHDRIPYGLLQPRSDWALKVFTFFASYFTEYSLTVSPTAEKFPLPRFTRPTEPASVQERATCSSRRRTPGQPRSRQLRP